MQRRYSKMKSLLVGEFMLHGRLMYVPVVHLTSDTKAATSANTLTKRCHQLDVVYQHIGHPGKVRSMYAIGTHHLTHTELSYPDHSFHMHRGQGYRFKTKERYRSEWGFNGLYSDGRYPFFPPNWVVYLFNRTSLPLLFHRKVGCLFTLNTLMGLYISTLVRAKRAKVFWRMTLSILGQWCVVQRQVTRTTHRRTPWRN